ncbi:MAG: glycine cleavage system protein GcvH [Armatimonadota bacterium]
MIVKELLYTKEHEWVKTEGDAALIGITEYAKDQLGDIVFVEMPEPGAKITQSNTFGAVESVKAVSDLYAPVTGEVIENNSALSDTPELINEDPYGKGWIIKARLENKAELEGLLKPEDYEKIIS